MNQLTTLLGKWARARQIFDVAKAHLEKWEQRTKEVAVSVFNSTPVEDRKSIIMPGVQVREELVVTLDLELGKANALVMSDVLRFSPQIALNENALLTLIGMVYSGKYPELQAALTIDKGAYCKLVKSEIEKRMKRGMTLDQARLDLNMPIDKAELKQTAALTFDNVAVEPVDDTEMPFEFRLIETEGALF